MIEQVLTAMANEKVDAERKGYGKREERKTAAKKKRRQDDKDKEKC